MTTKPSPKNMQSSQPTAADKIRQAKTQALAQAQASQIDLSPDDIKRLASVIKEMLKDEE